MSRSISKYIFEGPYKNNNKLKDRSGVYVIICRIGGKNHIIDVGESAKIKTRIEIHERKKIWSQECSKGTISIAVYYTPNLQQSSRTAIEGEIRNYYQLL